MQPDDLYGLPLDEFIAQRTALVRALRGDKQREEAAAVAALRKPSVAAWAVNQLVRTQGAAVQELYEAGDALRAAQSDLLAGSGDGQALRAANAREREAVDALVEAARGLLDADGHELSASVLERVADSLHAAALDEAAREQVRDGRLERELRHVGLGLGESAFAVAPPAAAKPKTKPQAKAGEPAAKEAVERRETKAERAARARREREVAAEIKRAERERAEARKAARATEMAARRRVERSGHALRAAEERRERAAQALADAEAALAAAQAEAREAADAQRAAQEELERL